MSKEDVAYAEWLEEIGGALPEELKPHIEALAAHEGGRQLFRGHLRTKTFHQRLNQLNDAKASFEREVASVAAERDQLAAQLAEMMANGGYDNGMKPEDLEKVLNSRVEAAVKPLQEKIQRMDQNLPSFLTEFAEVTGKIAKEGWGVSPKQVFDYTAARGVDFETALLELTADERKKREEERIEKIRKDAREEGRREALANSSPDHLRPAGPTASVFFRPGAADAAPTEYRRSAVAADAAAEFRRLAADGGLEG